MLSHKRFKLTHSTLGNFIDNGGQHKWLTIPEGATIHVISGPVIGEEDQTVRVRWEGRLLVMFAIDLKADGIELHGEVVGTPLAESGA